MPSIKKNFFYSSILTTANLLFPLITFPYVSRVLGVTNVGIVNFVDSIINYLVVFSMMGIGIVGIREVAKCKNNTEKLNSICNSLFWLNTLSTTVTLVILLIATLVVNQLRSHWDMMMIGALKLMFNYLLIEWLYKGLEEFRYITIRTVFVKIIYVASVFLFVQSENDYLICYFLMTMMIVVNAIINLAYSRYYIRIRFKDIHLFAYLKPFLTLGIYNLLTSMYTSFNVIYLGFACGEEQVGYYSTASKLYKVFIALFTAFTGVMLPRMSSLLSEGNNDEFRRLLNKSVNILLCVSIPLIVFSIIYAPVIVELIAGKGYEGAIIPMRIMMPLLLIIGYEQILIIQTLMPLKKDNAILTNSIIGAFVGLILNVSLVSSLASIGSSLVWLVSEISVLLSGQYYVYKYVRFGFPVFVFFKMLVTVFPLILILLVFYNIPNTIFSLFLGSMVSAIYVALFLFLFQKDYTKSIIRKKFVNKW